MIILSTLINIPLYHSDKDTIGFVGLILMAIQCFLIVVSKSATTSSTGGLILPLQRGICKCQYKNDQKVENKNVHFPTIFYKNG